MHSVTNNNTDRPNNTEAGAEQIRKATESFANVFHRAYLDASDEVRGVITSMVRVISDPSTDPEDRESCLDTLSEALFPTRHKGELGVDLQDVKTFPSDGTDIGAVEREMAQQEDSFAQNLDRAMHRVGMTQVRLAELAGVGQPAIAMMLSRQCRPQRRTIKKFAEALGVSPQELWPGYSE